MLVSNNNILNDDLKFIYDNFEDKKKFKNKNIVIIGCAGFLGFYFSTFFLKYLEQLNINKLILIDIFPYGKPNWIKKNINNKKLQIKKIDITKKKLNLSFLNDINYIIHAATFASPTYYRKFPLETLEANIIGLKNIFNYIIKKKIKINGSLFFSSSEIYGDPNSKNIPTSEYYNGNVPSTGPRSCYDESKRLGETLCWIYSNHYNVPITVVRPFNNYGPGMKLNDGRLPADLAKNIIKNKNIIIYSDGKPTRTYCYISDAINGYLRALVYGKFDIFNIGNSKPEVSVKVFTDKFIKIAKKHLGYNKKIIFKTSKDNNYLTNNPNRRCPNISKARNILGFKNYINLDDGINRYLEFLKQNNEY